MLTFVTAWLIGGVLIALGARCLLHLKQTKFDHVERMAEIALDRTRLEEEVARGRAERASRTRPDLAELLAALDAPTEVFEPVPAPPPEPAPGPAPEPADVDLGVGLFDEPAAPAQPDDPSADDPATYEPGLPDPAARVDWPLTQDNDVEDSGRHRLPTLS